MSSDSILAQQTRLKFRSACRQLDEQGAKDEERAAKLKVFASFFRDSDAFITAAVIEPCRAGGV